ncbi:MAG: MBL fold metallo-hydrolase [Archaeoglobaceae archaeon]
MKITILADNKVIETGVNLKAEWGFSALVEFDEPILFDTGKEVAFENLKTLKKDLPKKIILSHGHYDHTTGIVQFLDNSEVYAHPDVFLPRFLKGRYIGIPYLKSLVESRAKIFENTEPQKISKNIWLSGEIPRIFGDSTLKEAIIVREGKKEFDQILDDQAIFVKSSRGILVLVGCCHAGLLNTLKWAEEVLGDEVKAIVGGMHLVNKKDDEVREIVKKIDYLELIAPCHCTGLKAEMIIADFFKERYKAVGSGSVLGF